MTDSLEGCNVIGSFFIRRERLVVLICKMQFISKIFRGGNSVVVEHADWLINNDFQNYILRFARVIMIKNSKRIKILYVISKQSREL